MNELPRIVFVLGKGGVGRSTVAAALGARCAARRESTLVVQWALADPISPWFGLAPAGHQAQQLAPGLWTMNYSFDETVREYFVGHLGLRFLHDKVIASRHVQRAVRAVPGLQELLFIGRLFWLTELAEQEIGVHYDRIVVDAPATGHGLSIFGLPATLKSLGISGLLALESARVARMLADPRWTGALVVTLPEELAAEETLELIPALRRESGRGPLAVAVNRSARRFVSPSPARWDSPVLALVHEELSARVRREEDLRRALGEEVISVDEALLTLDDPSPRQVVARAAEQLA